MRTSARIIVVLAALACASTDGARAQERDTSARAPMRPRIGVVLSGGGARGLAHIGVLRVLEDEGIVPEVVTGASMGALIGGLYAIGYSPASLDSLVTSLEWATLFRDTPERRFLSLDQRFAGGRTILNLPFENGKVTLPTGAISGQHIADLLARLTWHVRNERDFRRFPRAFAATATDIETGETVVLDTGSLVDAMRASMSIPSIFAPTELHGRLLIDGGVTRNLPARDARALGADLLICSDVSSPLFPASRMRSLIDVLMQTITIYMQTSTAAERELCDVYIRPNTTGLTAADFDRAGTMIARGREAAGAARAQLREATGHLDVMTSRVPAPVRLDSVLIAAVHVEGVSAVAERTVRDRLRLPPRGYVTAAMLQNAVQRIYATELFDHVGYRFEARSADTILVVSAATREQDRVGLGLRYDDTYDASMLLTVRLRNRLGFGSTTQFDVRLGEQLRVAVQHGNVGFARSHFVVGSSLSYSRTPIPVFEGGEHVDDTRVEVRSALVLAGVLLGDQGALGVELKGERARASVGIASADSARSRTFATGALVLRWSSLDEPFFPSRGALLSLRSERALTEPSFAQHVGSATIAVPLSARVTALGRATVGKSSPESAIPLHYRFMMGGSYPAPLFPETQVSHAGLRARARSGAAVVRLGGALQWEVRRDIFATVRGDIGQAGPALTLDRAAYDGGVALALGASTPVGPLEIAVSGQPGGGAPRLEASLGYVF
ncbi:MAG TPA: patatin-like phospholipase family protein [Gemmatimonadaceae bacterium]|nr:patatin-like phospholipase family protein [Gemmatimonadaceae bacterium]